MKKLFPMLLLCLMLWSTSAMASMVVVTADSNIGYSTNNPFFSNVFSDQTVLATSTDWLLLNHVTSVSAYATSLTYNTNVLTSALLSAYDWVMLSGSNFLDNFERAAVVDYVLGGGNLWLVGEYDYWDNYNAEVNNTLVALGSSIRLLLDVTSAYGEVTTTDITPDPLTAGLDGYAVGTAGALTGGNILAYIDQDVARYGVLSYETYGTTTVPEPSSFVLAALGLLGLVGLRRKLRD